MFNDEHTEKAILVINMPNTCGECPICASYAVSAFSTREYWCTASDNRDADPNKKPDWCPLKEVPSAVDVFVDDWADGYNACLEDIFGGK